MLLVNEIRVRSLRFSYRVIKQQRTSWCFSSSLLNAIVNRMRMDFLHLLLSLLEARLAIASHAGQIRNRICLKCLVEQRRTECGSREIDGRPSFASASIRERKVMAVHTPSVVLEISYRCLLLTRVIVDRLSSGHCISAAHRFPVVRLCISMTRCLFVRINTRRSTIKQVREISQQNTDPV